MHKPTFFTRFVVSKNCRGKSDFFADAQHFVAWLAFSVTTKLLSQIKSFTEKKSVRNLLDADK